MTVSVATMPSSLRLLLKASGTNIAVKFADDQLWESAGDVPCHDRCSDRRSSCSLAHETVELGAHVLTEPEAQPGPPAHLRMVCRLVRSQKKNI
jgi:hypothetical protein